ncbi:hypothetical protein LUR56_39180 [Streptomyces sp. MT29]|nr:hypothetical protein [Streptomyces sp. MT29]
MAGVPQLDKQADEGAVGQDGLDASFLDDLDRGRGAEVVVVHGQGGEPPPVMVPASGRVDGVGGRPLALRASFGGEPFLR